jgi:cyclin D5
VLCFLPADRVLFLAAASVLDYRPSTVAVAAVLAATHGVLTKEALESKMTSLSPSCLLDKVAC